MRSLPSALDLYLHDAKKVGIFFGSFDPFHCGHREVVDVCLKHYCDRVICGAIKTNRNKPNLSCHKQRYELMRIGLNGSDAFALDNRIDSGDIAQFVRKIRERFPYVMLIGIIGADTYLRSGSTKKLFRMKVDHFVIVPRKEHPIMEISDVRFSLMKTIFFTRGAGLELSSTQIRKSFTTDQGVKATYLWPESARYIRDHLMYRDLIPIVCAYASGEITHLSRGISGHHVFRVENRVVKIFTDVTAGTREIEMLRWMYDNDIPTIQVLDYVVEATYSVATTKWISDACLFESCSEQVFELAEKIGKTLRHIHDSEYTQLSNLEFWAKILEDKNIDAERFRKNPGRGTLWLYGDLNLSNILVRDGNPVFIDPEPFQGGPPAYDYYRFLASARKYQQWAVIYRGFMSGYGDTAEFTSECKDVFIEYWGVRQHLKYVEEKGLTTDVQE